VGVGWQKSAEYVAKVQAVSVEQLQAVAKKYLIEDHLTVVYMLPNDKPQKTVESQEYADAQ